MRQPLVPPTAPADTRPGAGTPGTADARRGGPVAGRTGTVRVVLLHAQAPAKPAAGQPCNGCGVCCAWAPCPAGMVLSARRRGACAALTWDDAAQRYRCGLLVAPRRWVPWLPAAWTRRLAHRWIAAATGCDAGLDVG